MFWPYFYIKKLRKKVINMDNISNIIANLGFPIACVLGCAYFIYNNNKSQKP